jgi:branched-chain amino acid transport system permease protein
MTQFWTVLVSGALIGVVYAAIGTGFSIALGECKVVNFAHGQFVVAAAYLTFSLSKVMPLYAAGVLVVIALAGLGYLLHYYVLDPLARNNAPSQIVITVVLASIIESIVALAYGTDGISETRWPAGHIITMGLRLNLPRLIGAGVAIVLLFGLAEFLVRNRWGLAVRAAGDDVYGTELTGYSGRRVLSFGFAIATGMAGTAGVLLTPIFGFAPFQGLTYTLLAFVIVVVGGPGALRAAVVVGIGYGIIEGLGTYWFSADVAHVSLYVAMLLAIGVRGRLSGPISPRAIA